MIEIVFVLSPDEQSDLAMRIIVLHDELFLDLVALFIDVFVIQQLAEPFLIRQTKDQVGPRMTQIGVDQQRLAAAASQTGRQLAGHRRLPFRFAGTGDEEHIRGADVGVSHQSGADAVDRFGHEPVHRSP